MTRATEAMMARRRVPRGRIKVLFLVHHPEAWYSLAEVYEHVARDPDFEAIVATLPRRFPGSEDFVDEEFVHERMNHFAVPHVRFNSVDPFWDLDVIRMMDPDLIFRQSQWDGDIPNAFSTYELRFSRLCLVPYEMMNLVFNPLEQAGVNTAMDGLFQRNAWAVFCANDAAKRFAMSQAPATGGGQYVVTGHPKADLLRRLGRRPRSPRQRFTVLWSAHHSIGTDWIRFGTFPTSAPVMLEAAREHPDWDFIFSAHPALVTKMRSAEPPLSRQFVDDFTAQWADLPNTSTFSGGDYAEVFDRADALLTDGLSWMMEFQLLEKPVVYVERPDHRPFNELGEQVLRGTNTVPTTQAGIHLLEGFAKGAPDPRAAQQKEVSRLVGGSGQAAERVVASIKAKLAAEGWAGHV
jgi:hypothetical protein